MRVTDALKVAICVAIAVLGVTMVHLVTVSSTSASTVKISTHNAVQTKTRTFAAVLPKESLGENYSTTLASSSSPSSKGGGNGGTIHLAIFCIERTGSTW
jgi:hypothetical protein